MRRLILPLALIFAATFLTFYMARAAAIQIPRRDMQSFWTAAQQAQVNPYRTDPEIGMRNPPFTVPFVLPFRFFSYETAFGVWTVVTIVLIAACGRVLWGTFNPVPSLLPAVLSLVFGPTFCLLLMGQLDALVVTGIALFLWANARNHQFLAGSALVLISIKPHIILAFLVAVLLWILQGRRWRVLVGAVVAFTISSLAALAVNRHIFAQYFSYIRVFTGHKDPDPNLAGLLYQFTGRTGLALVPEILGLVWVVYYFWRRHQEWDWNREGILCIMASLFCSYYSYPYDEVIVLPAVLVCAAQGRRRTFLALFSLINLGYFLYLSNAAGHWGFGSLFLSWTGTAWLIAYLLCRPKTGLPKTSGALS